MFDIPRAIEVARGKLLAAPCRLLMRRHREINLLFHPYSVYSAKYTPITLGLGEWYNYNLWERCSYLTHFSGKPIAFASRTLSPSEQNYA